MDSSQILQALRTLMVLAGLITTAWGVYEFFGEGQQSSVGIKRIFGGLALAMIGGFVLTWAIGEMKALQSAMGGGASGAMLRLFLLPWR